ncbi:unnamed protein product [Pedinophyceae sp. YPF-701]|nr:unnamed protein product [Pedinophyceae sp. YPF-701]
MEREQPKTVAYVGFMLGDRMLHQLHTVRGKMFVMGEIAEQLFDQSPTSFLQELRAGRYPKVHETSRAVLATVAELGLPTESTGGTASGIMMLPAEAVTELLADKRRADLVEPFKVALLKLGSQEAARLMAAGDYESALPVALDAVAQGQVLFRQGGLEMFPLYLLAAQANLGMRRERACEDLLSLASHLANSQPQEDITPVMAAQKARLWGQLYSMQGRQREALQSFAEDVYNCSLAYGPSDIRTSLGFYNIGKALLALGEREKSLANHDQAGTILVDTMRALVLDRGQDQTPPPLNDHQLVELTAMIRDVMEIHSSLLGPDHPRAGDLRFVLGLCMLHAGQEEEAKLELTAAREVFSTAGEEEPLAVVDEALSLCGV